MSWLGSSNNENEKGQEASYATSARDMNTSTQDMVPNTTIAPSLGGQEEMKPRPNCCTRFCSEIKPFGQPYFSVIDSVNGRLIDIPESFAPKPGRYGWIIIWKVFILCFGAGSEAYGFVQREDASQYLMFLTHWGVTFCNMYFCMSLLNAIMASRTPQPDDKVGLRIKLTWILFTTGAVTAELAAVVFWVMLFEKSDAGQMYVDITGHAVILFLILVDGLIVNRIPVRLMHWYITMLPVFITYTAWTVIHSFTNIGNAELEAESDTDETITAMYDGVIDWQGDWQTSLFWVFMTGFVLSPLLYIVLWLLSLYSFPCFCCGKDRRRYTDSFRDDPREREKVTVDDVEEGSIFAKWR